MAGKVLKLLSIISSVCIVVKSIDEISEKSCQPEVPKAKLLVSYCPETDTCNEVSCGVRYTDSAVNPPKIEFPSAEKSALYTLLMVDPDAPRRSNPVKRFWLHWLVVNIPGTDIAEGKAFAEDSIKLQYNGPAPPPGSGDHRYFFYLYKQPATLSSLQEPNARGSFDVNKFVKDNQLNGPVALNMFTARTD